MSSEHSHAQLNLFLQMLCLHAEQDSFLDLRWRRPGRPMRRRFIAASRRAVAEATIRRLTADADVYVGVALRDGSGHGGRSAIAASHLVWVESDNASTAERLRSFACPPSMLIASGTPGHVQAYWLLDRPHPPAQVEAINRRLSYRLAGDPGCTDIARILRAPGTLNHKHSPPQPVSMLAARHGQRLTLDQLRALCPPDPDPPTWRPSVSARLGRTELDRLLLAIPAREYARALTAREPDREGKIICPFHEDANASLQLYPDGGFYCFGSDCRRGGSIYDFAAHLWGIEPRGTGFLELRTRLAERLLPGQPAVTGIPPRRERSAR